MQARDLQRSGNLLQLVDENLGSQYSQKEAIKMIELGLLCVSATSAIRPSMSEVVSVLEGGEFVGHEPSSINQEMRYADGNLSISKGKYHSQASTSIIQSYIDDLTRWNLYSYCHPPLRSQYKFLFAFILSFLGY